MKVFDVIFYYYDRFMSLFEYLEPEFSAMLAIAGGMGFILEGPFCFLTLSVFDVRTGPWPILLIFAIFGFLSYRRFIKSGRYKQIRKEKPVIINKTVSIIITVLYFFLGVFSLVFFTMIGKNWR